MKQLLLIISIFSWLNSARAQHTFSIVAVDSITGEVGSAGASCLDDTQFPGSGGAILISDILPGKGAIHTQSFWIEANQINARQRMEDGLSPSEIIDWLKNNDVQGIFNAQKRQYGIVDFDANGSPRAAAFTGNSCFDWKGHRVGSYYSIQGNILLGPEIVDSMEARFLATSGPLADRLMAALQGANVAGADTRCLQNGTSSLSAFVRVAKPGDAEWALYLDLNVPSLPAGAEPIDSLQTLFDAWQTTSTVHPLEASASFFPNPAHEKITVVFEGREGLVVITDIAGRKVFEKTVFEGANVLNPGLKPGVYFININTDNRSVLSRKLIWQ